MFRKGSSHTPTHPSNDDPMPVAGKVVDAGDYVNVLLADGGSTDMGVKGDVTPVNFIYTVPAGKEFSLGRMMMYISSDTAFDEVKFAHLTALANGVEIRVNGTLIETWKTNSEMILSMFDLSNAGSAFTKVTKSLAGRWSFHKANKGMAGLKVEAGNTVEVRINDDLLTLTVFHIAIQGILKDID